MTELGCSRSTQNHTTADKYNFMSTTSSNIYQSITTQYTHSFNIQQPHVPHLPQFVRGSQGFPFWDHWSFYF